MRRLLIAVCLLTLGCEGPVGPTGPAGDTGATGAPGQTGLQGPQGTPGGGATLYTRWGIIDADGNAWVGLPPYDYAPVLSCFISEDATVWFAIAQTAGTIYPGCAIVVNPENVREKQVQITRAPQGWHYFVSMVF